MTTTTTSHLKKASDDLGLARDHVIVGAADAVQSGMDAAGEIKAALGESVDSMREKGGNLVDEASGAIRSRPWKAVGIALASGYLLARLSRRG